MTSRKTVGLFGLLTVLALTSVQCANATSVIGFDLGSTFFKITLVKPGQSFQIVENVTSKRKTESMMTIGPEQRLFSADSFVAAARYPKTTFTEAASQFGVTYDADELARLQADRFVMNEFVEDDRGMVGW